jgi:hypothetical protein
VTYVGLEIIGKLATILEVDPAEFFRRPSRTGRRRKADQAIPQGTDLPASLPCHSCPLLFTATDLGPGRQGMDINRRQVLIVSAGAALAGSLGVPAGPDTGLSGILDRAGWHPLTRSLLERARRIDRGHDAPDRTVVERTIRQLADASGCTEPPIIKWIDTPTDAFDHLSRFGLDALLDMGTTRFWRRFQPPASSDADTFDRAFEVRMMANELLGVDVHDRILMAPRLRVKSEARSASLSDEEVFHVRAVSSQIGWLETSMADAAAQAVSDVELLLRSGASEGSVAIDHQLKVFESYECGLVATWETPDALICVQRIKV